MEKCSSVMFATRLDIETSQGDLVVVPDRPLLPSAGKALSCEPDPMTKHPVCRARSAHRPSP